MSLYPGPTVDNLAAIPTVLKQRRQWILWRGQDRVEQQTGEVKLNKIPINAQTLYPADTMDPMTWQSFTYCTQALPVALEQWSAEYGDTYRGGGLGYVFSHEDPFVGIDFDGCRNPATGIIADWAQIYLTRLGSYTEISPSACGVKIWVRGKLPPHGRKKGQIEMYEGGRFFTVTGWHLPDTPDSIAATQEVLTSIHLEVFGTHPQAPPLNGHGSPPILDDAVILAKASTAANHERFDTLWAGNTEGFLSPSEAEFSLCIRLAFWTQNAAQIDRLFRQSGLMRTKWDEKRGQQTYGTRTISEALARQTDHYSVPLTLQTPTANGQHAASAPGWHGDSTSPTLHTATEPWREMLLKKKDGNPTQNVSNVSVLLHYHPFWQRPDNQLWWDEVRSTPMQGEQPIDDDAITCIAAWLGTVEKMGVSNLRMIRDCVLQECRLRRKDLLQHWLHALPTWDQTSRLDTWLQQVAGVPDHAYGRAVSRILPLSMVARALDPGCLCRHVVILEGPEEAGKSALVRELATPEWYVVLAMGLDTKDSHMMLQGAWLAELAELDSLSRTEETRLKAFLTLQEDSYVPKYSNFRISQKRRTVFVGTTNEESYLKGQTGNTRFLPITVQRHIDVDRFRALRQQLMAEALHVYQSAPHTWWQLNSEAQTAATEQRERRRLTNVYEQPLHEWLEYGRFTTVLYDEGQAVRFTKEETSWPEIARWFLKLDTPERWKDQMLQRQIAQALRTLGWHAAIAWRYGRTTKIWQKAPQDG